jgi:hypothetical protein
MMAIKLLVAMQKRGGCAIDSGHGRPQLVRDRRHEIALLLLESHLFAEIPERLDHIGRALHGDEWQPEVAFAYTNRDCYRPWHLTLERDRYPLREVWPFGNRGRKDGSTQTLGPQADLQLSRTVPQRHDTVRIENEDAVANRLQNTCAWGANIRSGEARELVGRR